MGNHSVSYQSPRPEVKVYHPDKDKPYLEFDTLHRTVLQGYSFGTSINDEKGRFSLTFYPDDERLQFREDAIFDQIHPMDIVEIYESQNHFIQKSSIYHLGDSYDKVLPTFTGVIREKKFATQKTDNRVSRKIVVTGHSIAGLVHEFKISLDTTAFSLTKQTINSEVVRRELTNKFMTNDNKPLEVGYVVKEIWKSFLNLSSENTNKISTPKIAEYIGKWIGNEDALFNVDDSVFHYPLAVIFNGESTQTFYDIISSLIPKPMYEVFPFTDRRSGKMRLKIREVPFDDGVWKKLIRTEIDAKLVKSFDVKQSDSEVYTVFYSYLRGSALQEDRAIRIAVQESAGVPEIKTNTEKYGKYGYRPLFITFNGYGIADGTEDTKTGDRLKALNERLENWYSNKELMYSGSISMETDLSKYMPQAGEKISFLGGEFYVVDSEHTWNYGSAPETKISIDRGGDYSSASFSELMGIAKRYKQFKELQDVG
jgi:hypothetical protein